MTAKEYLLQYRKINSYIDCKLDQIVQLRALATRLSPTAMFDRNGNVSDKVGRSVAKIVDLERRIDREVDDLIAKRNEISHTISEIGDYDLRTVLEYRYMSGWNWRRIAAKMHYTEKHVTGYLHRKSLHEIEKLIPHDTFSVV